MPRTTGEEGGGALRDGHGALGQLDAEDRRRNLDVVVRIQDGVAERVNVSQVDLELRIQVDRVFDTDLNLAVVSMLDDKDGVQLAYVRVSASLLSCTLTEWVSGAVLAFTLTSAFHETTHLRSCRRPRHPS